MLTLILVTAFVVLSNPVVWLIALVALWASVRQC